MHSILFVCLGNICRSPMAECVFRHLAEEAGEAYRWRIDSAGTSAWHAGEAPDRRTATVLHQAGITCTGSSRQVRLADFTDFGHILAMDEQNLSELRSLQANSDGTAALALLGDWDPEGQKEVGDPYYGGADGFTRIYTHIRRSCEAFLADHG